MGGVASGGIQGGTVVAGGAVAGGAVPCNPPTPYYGGAGGVSGGAIAGGAVVGEKSTLCGVTEEAAAACVCAGAKGPAVMSFVGAGCGDYITETSYKYVGYGRGDLTLISPLRNIWGRFALLVSLLVVVVILVILLWPGVTITTTRMGECTYWGDPHVSSFDHGRPSFYGEGEAWIVKSYQVKIQGRYMGTKFTKGLASTSAVAVGGAFLKGHVIVVGSMESGVFTVDGQTVLPTFGTYNIGGFATITYNDQGELVDAAAGVWKKHVVHMMLPLGVQITVFRWSNYIDLRIRMPRQPDQDGGCGNFDGNPVNDATAQIQARVGVRVEPGQLLFHARASIEFTAEEHKLIKMCPPAQYAAAVAKCAASFRGAHIMNQNKACILDACYGANEHTLRYAKSMGI